MLEDIYNSHESSLRRLARSVSRHAAEADDLVQETFLRALSHEALLQTLSSSQKTQSSALTNSVCRFLHSAGMRGNRCWDIPGGSCWSMATTD